MSSFNSLQQRMLLSGCVDIHQRLAEMESLLEQRGAPAAFSEYVADLAPVEQRVLRDYFARIREAMVDLLTSEGIALPVATSSLRWALEIRTAFLRISVAEMAPEKLRGYGTLSAAGREAALRMGQELDRLIEQVARFLRRKSTGTLAERFPHAAESAPELSATLQRLDGIVTRHGLVEFRPQWEAIVQRLEAGGLEVAVFGRVSSGKSSLLNHIAGVDVLPVGVTPITAVPTRLAWGEKSAVAVEFAESSPQQFDVAQLAQFASEAENPGNFRHVTRIEVHVPSPKLQAGMVFVDTPGIGSLARAGSAETYAYLPRCDLGVVLIDAGSSINDDDLNLMHLLLDAGIPVQVLLSKADLLSLADRRRMCSYLEEQARRELGLSLPVYPVSIVGEDEALLRDWFEREIAPLCARHRELALASLGRKVARLGGLVLAALEGAASAPAGERWLSRKHGPELQSLLEKGDALLRQAEGRARDWPQTGFAPADSVLERAAVRASQDGHPSGLSHVLQDVVNETLAERGQSALRLVTEVRTQLVQALHAVASAVQELPLDPQGLDEIAIAGLPVATWVPPSDSSGPPRPWWTPAFPALARRVMRERLARNSRVLVRDVLETHDRQLSVWMRDGLFRLRTAYESQVDVVRAQLRRERVGSATAQSDGQDVQDDIQWLRQECSVPPPDGPAAAADDGPRPCAATG